MDLDQSWMKIITTNPLYERGFNEFLDFSFSGCKAGRMLHCPCKKCKNDLLWSRNTIMSTYS